MCWQGARYFDLTIDKMEAEWAELIAIILNVAKIIIISSIDERMEHELGTNRRNNEEERCRKRLLYRRKRADFFASFHI